MNTKCGYIIKICGHVGSLYLKKKNLDKKVNYPRIAGNVVVLHEFVPYPTMISIKNMSMNMRATH